MSVLGSSCDLILINIPAFVVRKDWEIYKNLIQDSRSPDQDLNPGPPNTQQEF